MKKEKSVREPIATWWEIEWYRAGIKPVKIVAFTNSFVTVLHPEWRLSGLDGLREQRQSRDDVFPTFEEAKSEIIQRAQRTVDNLECRLHEAKSFLGRVQAIKEPA
jgi:hypothetical protein